MGNETPSWAIALLAAILDPEGAGSQQRRERSGAVRRAQQFIGEVPKLLNAAFKDLSTAEMGAKMRAGAEERDLLREHWGLSWSLRAVAKNSPGGNNLTFKDASEREWCHHKTQANLVKFMERADYPKDFIASDEITKEAYLKASEINDNAKRSRDAELKRQRRAKPVREPNKLPLADRMEPKKRNRSRTKSPNSRTFGATLRTVEPDPPDV